MLLFCHVLFFCGVGGGDGGYSFGAVASLENYTPVNFPEGFASNASH